MDAVMSMESTTDRTGDGYEQFSSQIIERFQEAQRTFGKHLFTTDADGLFDAFLAGLPDDARQHYNCNCCRQFVNRYGGLVAITEKGGVVPVMWAKDVPAIFQSSTVAIRDTLGIANVTGVFLSNQRVWGTPVTGEWHHMHVTPPSSIVFSNRLLTASQVMAEKVQDYEILARSLTEYTLATVEQAIVLLQTESLYRSERCLGVTEWFRNLHQSLASTKNAKSKANMIWLAVASAPTGFAHIRSSMIGTLLDDIQAGMEFGAVSRRFAEKMNPLQYQRPQAAPTVGNIAQAEKLVEKLGITNSLKRRFATLADIQALWLPKQYQPQAKTNGVFGHLKTKIDAPTTNQIELPLQTMTWVKFRDTVLPNAGRIKYMVEREHANYSALLTAVDMDAPPILQWDSAEQRNPVSWYVYHHGSTPLSWNLFYGWVDVTAVTMQPSMWNGGNTHQGESVYFILDGAKDTRYKSAGAGLFPEILKSELREVRTTIEAYSRSATLDGYDEASACGLRLQKGSPWSAVFRVTSATGTASYKLDRWD